MFHFGQWRGIDLFLSPCNAQANNQRVCLLISDEAAFVDKDGKGVAYMQGQRYFVERTFRDAKTTAGMDHYQIRGWLAWHHHMAMVMMAMLFLLETRQEQEASHPLLSCPNIAGLLTHFLLRRDITPEEVLRQMEVRHRQRKASIDSAYRRQVADG